MTGDTGESTRLVEADRPNTLWHLGLSWSGVMLSPTPIIAGVIVTASMQGVGYPLSIVGLVIGYVLGAAAVAYLSVWGARTGLSQMALGGLAFGRGNVVIQVFLLLTLIVYSALNLTFGVSALTTALNVPFAVGLVGAAAVQLLIGIVGIRLLGRIGLVITAVMLVVIVALAIGALGQMPPPATSEVPIPLAPGIFLGIALGLGNAYSWGIQAADTSRSLPAATRPWAIAAVVFFAMVVPLTVLAAIGARIATMVAVNSPMERMFEVLGGGIFAVLALVAMGMSLAAENGYNDFSNILTLRSWGVRLPAPVIATLLTLLAVGMTIVLSGTPLGELAENSTVIAGYFAAPWFGVLAVELIRRRRQSQPWEVPAPSNVKGAAAFAIGYAVVLVFTHTAVGDSLAMDSPVLSWIGVAPRIYLWGVELGYFAGTLAGALAYLALLSLGRSATKTR